MLQPPADSTEHALASPLNNPEANFGTDHPGSKITNPLNAGQFVDVTHRELVTDPLAVVRRIYDRFDARPTWAVAERMRRLASKRSRYERRSVSPKLADFRLDCAAETPQ